MLDDLLLADFDVVTFLQSYGYNLDKIGGRTFFLTTCAFCNKPLHMGVNPIKKSFGCFKCHTGGKLTRLVGQILKKNYYETLEFLKKGVDPRHYSSNFIEKRMTLIFEYQDLEDKIKPIPLPPDYISLNNQRIEYLDKRSIEPIPQEQVNYYKMGVCYTGKYANRLVVCDVNEDQEPIYWIARDFSGAVLKKDKVWNPPAIKVGSADLLFNYSLAKNYEIVVLTEGVFDSLWVGNNGIASYGTGIKANHLYWIIKGGFKEVILLYDADVIDEVLDKTALLLSTFVSVRICKLPEGDPDEYHKTDLYQLLAQAPVFNPSFKIGKMVLK